MRLDEWESSMRLFQPSLEYGDYGEKNNLSMRHY